MEDLSIFFEGISPDLTDGYADDSIGKRAVVHIQHGDFPQVEAGAVVLIGVPECRRTDTEVSSKGLNTIRRAFLSLKDHFTSTSVIDLGNILPGESVEDTYFALASAVAEVVRQDAVAVILGGGQDLTYANYLAYERLERTVNLVTIDNCFDLGDVEEEVRADRFLQKIVLHQPNILFNYSNLGYQTYYATARETEMMTKMYFDIYRLGEVQARLEETEPVIRTADTLSLDLTSIRASDFPSNKRNEPNGLYGEEACALCRYAGLSDKMSSFGIYEYDAGGDVDGRGAALIAQMLWYLAWGVANRKQDYPFSDRSENTKYTVTIAEGQYDIVFYKSPRSDRWWMEVPYPSKRGDKYERHFMVPCTYADYTMACANEVPDRWWQTYQKLG